MLPQTASHWIFCMAPVPVSSASSLGACWKHWGNQRTGRRSIRTWWSKMYPFCRIFPRHLPLYCWEPFERKMNVKTIMKPDLHILYNFNSIGFPVHLNFWFHPATNICQKGSTKSHIVCHTWSFPWQIPVCQFACACVDKFYLKNVGCKPKYIRPLKVIEV